LKAQRLRQRKRRADRPATGSTRISASTGIVKSSTSVGWKVSRLSRSQRLQKGQQEKKKWVAVGDAAGPIAIGEDTHLLLFCKFDLLLLTPTSLCLVCLSLHYSLVCLTMVCLIFSRVLLGLSFGGDLHGPATAWLAFHPNSPSLPLRLGVRLLRPQQTWRFLKY